MRTMPKSVPVLRASQICRGAMDGTHGRHCLRGWLLEVFGASEFDPFERAAISCGADDLGSMADLVGFNDERGRPKAKVAELWNRVIPMLGYRRRGSRFVYVGKPTPRRPRRRGRG